VTRTFQSPRSYDPSYSLLGRLLRYWTGDRLRGEALYVVVLTGLALALLMSHYLGWALLKSTLAEHPSWQVLFWVGQLASVALLAAVGLVGLRPGVTVVCTPTGLEIEQGSRARTVPYEAVEAVDTVSATRYHRHYRRYAATDVFAGQLAEEVLLLRTDRGPIVVALADLEDQDALRAHVETVEADAPEPVPQPQS
jgi:MFS family permease